MNTTNHTSPSGEDAANGAIGEREAPLSLIPDLVKRDELAVNTALLEIGDAMSMWRAAVCKYREIASHDQSAFYDGYEAGMAAILSARAALTAEKVAAEPVAVGWPHLAELHADAAYMFQRVRQGTLSPEDATAAVRSKIDAAQAQIAAPQQPAQSAEQDERAAFDAWCKSIPANRSMGPWEIWQAARAASTQSTATQPAQTERALTVASLQQKAIDHGFKYWRAPDAHGVTATNAQAVELLQDLLGVEVEIAAHPEIGGKS